MGSFSHEQNKISNKDNLTTLLILAIMILQIVLLAGLLFRINQVYVIIAGGSFGANLIRDIPIRDAPSLGPDNAPVTIIEFSDYTCGYCRLIQETLTEILKKHDGQVRIVFRDFPQGGQGSLAFNAALAARCSGEQGKLQEMRAALYQNQPRFDPGRLIRYASEIELDLADFEECMNLEANWTKVRTDYEDGLKYGVSATPTFFINGRILVGAAPLSEFERLINLALQEQE
jgi:protein-disulfide isomerase